MNARVAAGAVPVPDGGPEAADDCGGYVVPVDPMEDLQCDSCQ